MGGCPSVSATAVALPELHGKTKYIIDVGGLLMHKYEAPHHRSIGTVVVSAPPDYHGLCVAFKSSQTGDIFATELTDGELRKAKEATLTCDWGSFFKSIAHDTIKEKAQLDIGDTVVKLGITMTSSKAPTVQEPFQFSLRLRPRSNQPEDTVRYFLRPLARRMQVRKQEAVGSTISKEREIVLRECELVTREASRNQQCINVQQLRATIQQLKRDVSKCTTASQKLADMVVRLERKHRRVFHQNYAVKHSLDELYEHGGAQYFAHLPQAPDHIPKPVPDAAVDMKLCEYIRMDSFEQLEESSPSKRRSFPQEWIRRMHILSKIDDWDFNVFDLEAVTNHNALFYVTYTLLHKLDLVRHFHIDDLMLRRFLAAMQAGYHPNPYHNATHAADVCQINYFILTKGGLAEKCRLSKEQLLAAVLAGAIHDYDHPGFNNNFHSRTNAYLATLYNDRSILENHHLACIFEMLRHPNYRFLAHLAEAQLREIRETMIEMVLATDMALHQKYVSLMQRRLQDSAEWNSRKEDAILALQMSLKMADISICGRPPHLYTQWSRRISEEFFNQGDFEEDLGLVVSPFMNRHATPETGNCFGLGQRSFITFVGQPLFELMATLLPALSFLPRYCTENKEYWAKQMACFCRGASGA